MPRIEKPLGLYVVTLVDFVAFGVLQFFKIIADAQEPEGETSFGLLFIVLFLCVFTAASAVWAFFGDNSGRYALLFFISLNILWLVGNFAALWIVEDFKMSRTNVEILAAVGKTVWGLAGNWWYLTRDEVVAYFNQQSKIK